MQEGIEQPMDGIAPFGESNTHDIKEEFQKESSQTTENSITETSCKKPLTEILTEEDVARAIMVFSQGSVGVNGGQAHQEHLNGGQADPEHQSSSDEEVAKDDGEEDATGEETPLEVEGQVEQSPDRPSEMDSNAIPENMEIKKMVTNGFDEALVFPRNLRTSTLMGRISAADIPVIREGSSFEHTGYRPRPGGRKLQPWQEEAMQKAIEDCNQGVTVMEAAKQHGISHCTLRYRLKQKTPANAVAEGSVSPRIEFRRHHKGAVQKAMDDYDRGSRLADAAARFGVSINALYSRLKARNISNSRNAETGHKRSWSHTRAEQELVLQKAIQDYESGMRLAEAARENGVAESTLRGRIKRRTRRPNNSSTGQETMIESEKQEHDGGVSNRSDDTCVISKKKLKTGEMKASGRRTSAKLAMVRKVPWTKDNMQKALRDVRDGESYKEASDKHGIPPTTIRDHYYREHKSESFRTKAAQNRSMGLTQRINIKRRTGSQTGYSQDDLRKAMEEVKRGLRISQASAMYDIPYSTLAAKLSSVRENSRGFGATRPKKHFNSGRPRSHALPQSAFHSRLKNIGFRHNKTKFPQHERRWNEEDMRRAMRDIRNGFCMSRAALRNGIPSGTLNSRVRKNERNNHKPVPVTKKTWGKNHEDQLAEYIDRLGSFGFIPTNDDELLEIIKDFVSKKELNSCFEKDQLNKEWVDEFLQRNDYAMKMARMINSNQKAKSGSSNPFIVYNFYDALERISSEKNLDPNQIWTCCEAGFPSNPLKCKSRVKFDVGTEHSTTCLIACGGAGQVLDPFIIQTEKFDRSTLRGSVILPGTSYAASDSGCLTAAVFDDWLASFAGIVKQRPLLLIVDSQLTYLSVQAIESAASENIYLMKLPCNTSYMLQPLWQFCFSQLSSKWKSALKEWTEHHEKDENMTKADFAEQLCAVWHECLTQEDIIAGFESTGIFPVNRTQFPHDKLDKGLLRLHAVWLAAGKPEQMAPDLPTFFNPSANITVPSLPSRRATRSASQPVPLNFGEDDNQMDHDSPAQHVDIAMGDSPAPSTPNSTSEHTFPVCWCRSPPAPIPGKKWVPTWTLLDDDTVPSRPISNSTSESS